MSITILTSGQGRPLFVDFDQHTDGDQEFKKELILLMIDNIKELEHALKFVEKDLETFTKVIHKIKPTLAMLEDPDVNKSIENIKAGKDKQTEINTLRKLCAEVVRSLEKAAE